MRKIFLTLAMGAIAMSYSVAQDSDEVASMDADVLTSKKGVPILPESGDKGISIDGTNLLDYVGSLTSGFGSSSNAFQFSNGGQRITGKYFVDANTAYRATIRIGLNSTSNKETVAKMNAGVADATETVENTSKTSDTYVWIGGGLEKRSGKGRVQGFYGAEALVGFSSVGNTSTDWGNSIGDEFGAGAGNRTNESKAGTSIGFNLGAFVGVEYFFAPKLSIGGQFGWGLMLSTEAKSKVTTEAWDGSAATTTETESYTAANNGSFTLDTDNMAGQLTLNAYFP